jgi:hypothetical protein
MTLKNLIYCVLLLCAVVNGQRGIQGGFQDFSSLLGGLKLAVHGHYCGLNHGDASYKQSNYCEIS